MRAILLLIPFLALAGCQNQAANVEGSRALAQKWVEETLPGYKMTSFSSATLDTDDDGYVSCDITVSNDGAKTMHLIQLDCPTMGKPLAVQKGGGAKLKMIPYNNLFKAGGSPAPDSPGTTP